MSVIYRASHSALLPACDWIVFTLTRGYTKPFGSVVLSTNMALKAEQPNALPMPGDVLSTSVGSRHLISIVPHPHRLSFKDLAAAKAIAVKWSEATGEDFWHETEGGVQRREGN